jgi:hypothetical protein
MTTSLLPLEKQELPRQICISILCAIVFIVHKKTTTSKVIIISGQISITSPLKFLLLVSMAVWFLSSYVDCRFLPKSVKLNKSQIISIIG